jgi:hypothetical protein
MNWQFTRADVAVRFDKGEPRLLSQAPGLKQQYDAWNQSRLAFNVDLKQPGSQAEREK